MSRNTGQHVFVALSGGVDSATTALLLQERGYRVTGVFIKIWQPEFIECTWREDRLDAMRVAAALGTPFLEVDLSEEYKKEVIDDMLSSYKAGVTPNPDVLCNRVIKFGALWEWAKEHGADMLATGHHARVRESEGGYELLRGFDSAKDQTYFLWQLDQDDLSHTLLPVGDMEKRAVRALALSRNLPVAEKADSQGLCFVGDIDMHTFLGRFIDAKEGPVLSEDGTNIGIHDGAVLYTLGQRHKFRVTDPGHAKVAQYVIATDVQKNTITVAPEVTMALRDSVPLVRVHWINGEEPHKKKLTASVRYRQEPHACEIQRIGESVEVRFERPQLAVPGQSCVMFDGDVCLGGGIIA